VVNEQKALMHDTDACTKAIQLWPEAVEHKSEEVAIKTIHHNKSTSKNSTLTNVNQIFSPIMQNCLFCFLSEKSHLLLELIFHSLLTN